MAEAGAKPGAKAASKAEAAGARDLRAEILADPDIVLEDRAVIQALIAAHGGPEGRKIVDLRGALVSRLEARLDRLETTHRSVIAAAYDNLAGTAQIHNAVLILLEKTRFVDCLRALTMETPELVAVDCARLCVETDEAEPGPAADLAAAIGEDVGETLVILPPGGVAAYFALGRGAGRRVALRPTVPEAEAVFGPVAKDLRSEALVRLDLGHGRSGMLVFGAEDEARFSPDQGPDLLEFFGGVAERVLRRWLGPDV